MMTRKLWIFLTQLFLISSGISLGIKYGAPLLPPLPATPATAIILISLPALIVGMILFWRQQHSSQENTTQHDEI